MVKTFLQESPDHGEMYEEFYDAVNLIYREAINTILSLPQELRGNLKKRLRIIMQSANDIG